MNTTLRKIQIASLLLTISLSAFSQARHGIWQGHITVRGNSLLIPEGSKFLFDMVAGFESGWKMTRLGMGDKVHSENAIFGAMTATSKTVRWIYPTFEYDFHIPNWAMSDASGDIDLQGPYWWRCLLTGDFRHNYNLSLGYKLSWRSLDIPFGINFGASYEWRGLCPTDGALKGLHKTSAIVPAASISWRVLGLDFEREEGWNIVLEGGASYAKVLTYNDPFSLGKDAVDSGWRGVLSFGVSYSRTIWSLRYEWDTYNYFNIPNVETRLQNLVFSVSAML